jgi:hypothetical protein
VHHNAPPASPDNAPATITNVELVGDEYFQELSDMDKKVVFIDGVTKAELKKIQGDIAGVTRPQHRPAPPSNLGCPGHGKLKADQWKTCIEFDIPVSVAQLWSRDTCPPGQDPKVTERRDKLFQSIMHLAIAVRWGTSYRTSKHHSQMFQDHMKAYLQSLLDLYPDIKLRPNHHAALHIGDLLTRLGPVHGWWMFPFERVIGILQKINTNDKMGKYHELC